ncbi:hypothetical protein APY04_0175 [Hyphomicrobium sulfonivorans]|uniref:Uncharacterized protein n=1 Tax=Hyphomicrobium sulfonivorans TaxID=121290 RepID=A0A109BP61_HYPSL|nr:hypothetical protein APY04_0175 [Hyphomicrobium sulfonivorans]
MAEHVSSVAVSIRFRCGFWFAYFALSPFLLCGWTNRFAVSFLVRYFVQLDYRAGR